MKDITTKDITGLGAEMNEVVFNAFRHCYTMLKSGKLPKSYPIDNIPQMIRDPSSGQLIDIRNIYIKQFGFTLLSEDWIKPLARWIGVMRPCLEIMSGTGYLSYWLHRYGVRVKATDNFSWREHFDSINENWVENIDALDAIKKYGKRVKFIICSWPYMDDTAYEALMLMRKVNPKCRMIYIGEGYGGCTASEKFFDAMEECHVIKFEAAVSKYTQWNWIHDSIRLIK